MLENVKMAGYGVPTPVQAYCLPAIFKGHDIVACAQTGMILAFINGYRIVLTGTQAQERQQLSSFQLCQS
jgi:hypothetical protein